MKKTQNVAAKRTSAIGLVETRPEVVTLSEDAAAQVMWLYYRDHKQHLITDIRDYRAGILAKIMAGEPADAVFKPYHRPIEVARPTRLRA